jgi:hypothetical protein
MIFIPHQLKNVYFRFIKITMDGPLARKKPLEPDWQNTKNYQYFANELCSWIATDLNYGVATGYGNLAVIDADDPVITDMVKKTFPRTFTVKTGSGGTHFYYIVPDMDKKIILKDKDKKHYGEIQWKGQQVVGPGSLHPSNNMYTIIDNSEIATITKFQIEQLFKDYIKPEEPEGTYSGDPSQYDFIDIMKFCPTNKLHKVGDEWQGPHPVHGSRTGMNFCVNPSKGVWHCFRCGTGGGPISLLAIIEGIIKCDEYKPGVISPETYRRLVEIAKVKYGIIIKDD